MAKGKTKNFFVWIILGLLFVGLLGFGTTGLSGNVRTIGSVGELSISTQTYDRALRNQIDTRSNQLGRAVSFAEAEAQGLTLRAQSAVIGQRSLDNEVAALGLSVGDETISEQVLSQPAFTGTDGSFDRDVYREALARSRMSVREYETSLRENASRALLQGAVFTGIPAPQTFGTTFADFVREGRSFTWATLSADTVEVILPEPSEDDLTAHYDTNPDLYTSLELREIRYVWLTPAMIQDDVPVSEEELRLEYEARLDEYVVPERRLVERLAFADDAAAQAALEAIEAGDTTFVQLVEERGLTLDAVDIGDVSEAQMGDAGPAIFALSNGEVTGPFTSDLGPALFRMNAVLAARNTSFEEALPDLREDQAAARAIRVIDDQIDPINDLLAAGNSLEDIAASSDMELGTIGFTSETEDGIAAYANFREVAALQTTEDFPDLYELDDGGLFALEVLEIVPPALIPLEDIREDVVAGWEAEKTAALVIEAAEAKQAQLQESVTDFAALDLAATAEVGIQRRDFINGTPPTFMTTVFDMAVNEVQVIPYGEDAILVRLDAIAAAEADDDAYAAEQQMMAETAAEGIAQDIYEMYTRSVQLRTDVSISDAALNAVHNNFR